MKDRKRNPYLAICDILLNAVRSAIAYLDREESRQARNVLQDAQDRINAIIEGKEYASGGEAGPMKRKERYNYDSVCRILIPAMEKGYERIEQGEGDACVEILKRALWELDQISGGADGGPGGGRP